MIGSAAILMFALNGRIAGVSGILGGLIFDRASSDRAWRALFLAGLALGAFVAHAVQPDWGASRMVTGLGGLAVAGLLVGYGTRMGSGCTSGHGICGIARLSPRSIVATLTFMATGFATVFVLRHVVGAGS
jgi:uncharacterized membrane protein YedE/YeeE